MHRTGEVRLSQGTRAPLQPQCQGHAMPPPLQYLGWRLGPLGCFPRPLASLSGPHFPSRRQRGQRKSKTRELGGNPAAGWTLLCLATPHHPLEPVPPIALLSRLPCPKLRMESAWTHLGAASHCLGGGPAIPADAALCLAAIDPRKREAARHRDGLQRRSRHAWWCQPEPALWK